MASRMVAFTREVGCEFAEVNVKSDQEPAIEAVVTAMCRLRAVKGAVRTNVEGSPTYSSASNGIVERAIQAVEGQVRVLRSALETRWGLKLTRECRIWPWMVEMAGLQLNRGEVGHDGKTAYERSKGKTSRIHGTEFGEGGLWRRRPIGGALGKLSSLWDDGIFLGIKATTGEFMIGDKIGVHRTRTIQRKPIEERWKPENLEFVGGVPWRVSDDDPKTDGEPMQAVKLPEEERKRMADEMQWREKAPKAFGITKEDLEKHGYTKRCPGCLAVIRSTTRQKHTPACRKRMEEAMAEDDKVKGYVRKFGEFVDVAMEKDEEKEIRKVGKRTK